MTKSTLLVMLLSAGVILAEPIPKSFQRVKVTLDGRWNVDEWYSSGRKINSNTKMSWVISDESLTIEQNGVSRQSTVDYKLVLNTKEGKNAVDYMIRYNNGREITYRGIFEVDKDSLKLCYITNANQDRPTECKPSTGTVFYQFSRGTE